MTHQQVQFKDLGRIGYMEAWEYQNQLFRAIQDRKVQNRELAHEQQAETPNYLLFCEHPPVYTLGKSGNRGNLLISEEQMQKNGITFYKTNRGGDITYHGPGQVVGYPVIDLDNFSPDIRKYMRLLEETIIYALDQYGIAGERLDEHTGVWLDAAAPQHSRKICAQGVKTSRWITMHGWALNVNPDLWYFNQIIPCGIADKGVTSMAEELGYTPPLEEVKAILKEAFQATFGANLISPYDMPELAKT
jgi:lipoyl(octanoyl) transferase